MAWPWNGARTMSAAIIYFCLGLGCRLMSVEIPVPPNVNCVKWTVATAARILPRDAVFLGYRCGGQNFGPPESRTIIIPVPDDKTIG